MEPERYGLLLEEEDKRDLFDSAFLHLDQHYDGRPNMDQAEEVFGYYRDTLRKHREGEIDLLPLDLADRLYRVLERAEPIMDLENPERYIEPGSEKYAREGMERVEDPVQKWVFKRLTYGEFEELTGKSRSSFNRHRQNKSKRTDLEVFKKAVETVEDKMYTRFCSGNPVLVERKVYQSTGRDIDASQVSNEELASITDNFPLLKDLDIDGIPLHVKFQDLFISDGQSYISVDEQEEGPDSRVIREPF